MCQRILRWSLVGWLWLWATPVWGTTLSIANQPERIDADEPFTITASFSGSKSSCSDKTYFLVGTLFKEAGNNLFGWTEATTGAWVNRSELPAKSFSFTTDGEGSWSGSLRIKGDHTDPGFDLSLQEGLYYVRVDRFTLTGTSKAESSNSLPILLTHTPEPTPTPTATPTPSPSTSSGPTATPSPTPVVTTTPTTPVPSPAPPSTTTPSPSLFSWPTAASASPEVLGEVTNSASTKKREVSLPAAFLFAVGGLVTVAGAIPLGLHLFKED